MATGLATAMAARERSANFILRGLEISKSAADNDDDAAAAVWNQSHPQGILNALFIPLDTLLLNGSCSQVDPAFLFLSPSKV
jgi:hypothetical protein